jgi:hypothetical protein
LHQVIHQPFINPSSNIQSGDSSTLESTLHSSTLHQVIHQPLRVVRVAGRLAEKPPKAGQGMKGMIVSGPSGTGAVL